MRVWRCRFICSANSSCVSTARRAPLKGAKPQALLAWLAAGIDRVHPRDRLTGLLWGDHGESNARTSLRQALTTLRRVMPADLLHTDSDGVWLNSDEVWVDVARFTQLREGDREQQLRAAQLYDGELLDGFRARAAPFEDWLTIERERYRREAFDLLQTLLQDTSLDDERAIDLCGRLLGIDPLAEHIHRTLMSRYASAGRIGSALRQFRVCEAVLQRELGTPPAHDTIALMQHIRSGGEAPGNSTTAAIEDAQPAALEPTARATTDRQPRLPAVIVLPISSLSSDTEHSYLADGITDELINLLAGSATWRVIARNTSFSYKGLSVDVRELAADLNIDYLVEGSLRQVADQMRLNVQLVDAHDGHQLWSDRYERSADDIFNVQDELVREVHRVLRNRISFAHRERVLRTPPQQLNTWDLLLRAQMTVVRDAASRDAQRALIEQALQLDPDYPRSHALFASALFGAAGRGFSRNPAADEALAERHAERALATGHNDVIVLRLCATGYAAVGNAERALELAQRACDLNQAPDPLLVAVLMWHGRLEEALQHCRDIVADQPPGLPTPPGEFRAMALLGNLHLLRGELTEAEQCARQDLNANPDNFFAYAHLANVLGLRSEFAEARGLWNKAVALAPGLTARRFRDGYRRTMPDPALADRFAAGLQQAGFMD